MFARNRRLAAVVALGVVLVVVAGCGTQEPAAPPPQASSTPTTTSAAPVPPAVVSQIDARWMGFDTSQPWNWEEQDRRITSDFQQFGLRPLDETELPRGCNGCGVGPPTAFVTVYTPGKFDAAEAQTGQPVRVIGDDGFFRPSEGTEDAVLAWQYADNAWATVRGRTSTTSELDRMLDLARTVRPNERSPIRLPISFTTMPTDMPLAEINIDHGDYGTSLHFAPCGKTDVNGSAKCRADSEWLRVQIWPTDDSYGHINEQRAVPWKIGGKDGMYDKAVNQAAVQVQKGMLDVFEMGGPGQTMPRPQLPGILAAVAWPPDPGNEANWPIVADWAKYDG